jgi:hypothetical protein
LQYFLPFQLWSLKNIGGRGELPLQRPFFSLKYVLRKSMVAYRSAATQRLNKYVSVVRQQILNNLIVGLQQWKSSVFYVVRAERL